MELIVQASELIKVKIKGTMPNKVFLKFGGLFFATAGTCFIADHISCTNVNQPYLIKHKSDIIKRDLSLLNKMETRVSNNAQEGQKPKFSSWS